MMYRNLKRNSTFDRIYKKRSHFEEMKETNLFKDWKKEQYICQNGRCAWCRRHIDFNSFYTHVDHVKPLRYGGTDQYQNFVLTCKACNDKKSTSTHGYNSSMNPILENSIPSWIKKNPVVVRLEKREKVPF